MKSLLNTLGSDTTPQPNDSKPPKRKDSILSSVSTGFGETNVLIKECEAHQFKTPLFKEDYLSVFTSETEKRLIRDNLGILDQDDVTSMVKNLVTEEIDSFITIEKVEELLDDLSFVDSELKSLVDYTIPDKLFKL